VSADPAAGEKVSGGSRVCADPPSTASSSFGVIVVVPAASVWSMPSPSSTVICFFDEIVSFFYPLASRTRIEVVGVWPRIVPG
jgi:hypothetical protein